MMADLKERFSALDSIAFPHTERPPKRAEVRAPEVVSKNTRARVLVAVFALLVASAGIGFAVNAFRGEGPHQHREPGPGVAVPSACEEGPWIKYCPEADWARSVAASAGLDVVDEKTVLIIAPRAGGEFMFWAMDPAMHEQVTPLSGSIGNENFLAAGHVDGIPIYSSNDGQLFVWSSHGLNVFVREEISGVPPPRGLVVTLVRAAESVPYTSGEPSEYQQCKPPEVRPGYLPWTKPEEPIPLPIVSYDAEINRAQLFWTNPNYPQGQAGIGLTLYTHFQMGNIGERSDIVLDGVAGHLHGADEGGLVSISWTFNRSQCNFMELVLAAPGLPKDVAIRELLTVARSLA
jgi:hypothetical protein